MRLPPMRLQRYIFRELLPPLVTGTLLFASVVSFGYFFVSSQFLAGAPLGLVAQWIALQLPATLVQVFPMAVVLMVVVGYGRLANERELGAAQAGGVSLGRLAVPAALVALAVSGFSLYLSESVAPRANVAARSLYWDDLTGAGLQQLVGRTVDIGKGLELQMRAYSTDAQRLEGIRLQQWSTDGTGRAATVIFAREGKYEGNVLTLKGYRVYRLNYDAIDALNALPEDASDARFREGVRDVFELVTIPDDENAALEVDTGLSRREVIADYADAIGAERRSLTDLVRVIRDPRATPAAKLESRSELHRKLALPFGNLVLVLAALPFALRYGRTTGVAFGVALLIAVAYYLTYVLGLSLTNSNVLPPELGAWLANAVFAFVGFYTLRRAG